VAYRNTSATAGFTLSLVSLPFFILAPIGFLLSGLGVIMSSIGLASALGHEGRGLGFAIPGLLISLCVCVMTGFVMMAIMNRMLIPGQ
jgi:hypothetical protein